MSKVKDYTNPYEIIRNFQPPTDIMEHLGITRYQIQFDDVHIEISNIVSVWMSRFADESYAIEDLGKQLDNAISWLSENALCDLENNIIATATKFTRLVADNQIRYKGREGSRNKLVNLCEVFKQVTKIHAEMNAALKSA